MLAWEKNKGHYMVKCEHEKKKEKKKQIDPTSQVVFSKLITGSGLSKF